MKIAVAYDNGEIFLHFGHCRYFAVYTTNQDGTEVETKKLVESEASGHAAAAELMTELGVSAVICGNIGADGRAALMERGIIPFAGFEGDADTAAEMLVHGELPYYDDMGECPGHASGSCCCHGDGEEGCGCGGHDDEGGCGGGCCGH